MPPGFLQNPVFARSLPQRSFDSIQYHVRYRLRKVAYSTGSAKLFADAEREEQDAASKESPATSRAAFLGQQHENWTGDEDIKDAVLRMLMDKYKPLRSGVIQSAEEKLKKAPPAIGVVDDAARELPPVKLVPTSGSWANEPLLPSIPGHQPWHTTFKAPSHEKATIKFAKFPEEHATVSSPLSRDSVLPLDEKERRAELESRRKHKEIGRLGRAKESTLDYRLGIKGKASADTRPNPSSMKGWQSLVEDRIEKAKQAGVFNSVKGRGQPIVRLVEESNPFIAREEFLMNRIVQRNGAAPPWVELQGELDAAVSSFRTTLRDAWIRRSIRMLVLEYPGPLIRNITLEQIQRRRDQEWVDREESYHEAAIAELNSVVRKYNGLAPYMTRRPYYMRKVEIERLYEGCAEEILQRIKERETESPLLDSSVSGQSKGQGGSSGSEGHLVREGDLGGPFLRWLRVWLRRVLGV